MALSNIFNEPRREITETVVGIVVVGGGLTGFLTLDYHVVTWLGAKETHDIAFGMIMLPLITVVGTGLVAILGSGLALLTHFVGEEICDSLERKGVRLRPIRNR